MKTLAILGAGKLGIVLSQLALKAGYAVRLAASGDPSEIALTVKVLTPGAQAFTAEDAVKGADVIILALPLGKFHTLPSHLLDGKLVIDAMNYWWEVDGPRDEIIPDTLSSSEVVQAYFSGARVVKAFSHIGYHELLDGAIQKSEAVSRSEAEVGETTRTRKGIAIASDHTHELQEVAKIVDDLGFDPLPIGSLINGKKLEPGNLAFGADEPVETLRKLIA